MSLLVAKKGIRGIHIVSDSKLTDLSELRRGFLFGALKTIIIRPDLCIGYAGVVKVGLHALRKIESSMNLDQIHELLLKEHLENDQVTDYLVASLASPISLKVIKDGIISDTATAWIGSGNGFNIYQQHFNAPPDPQKEIMNNIFPEELREGILIKQRMENALSSAIEDQSVPEVGDFLIRVESSPQGFRYLESSVGFNFATVIGDTTDEQSLTKPGDTTSQGFNYSILVPAESGIGAFGVHFLQGNLGALYYPMHFQKDSESNDIDPPIQYPNTSFQDFILKVREEHGFLLKGIELGNQGFLLDFKSV